MKKAVLISIRPRWCQKIADGEKAIEIRKTRPRLEPPFKCYIYCTKPEERLICILRDGAENYGEIYRGKPVFIKTEKEYTHDMWDKRQKVIGEFVCDRIDTLIQIGYMGSAERPKYHICTEDFRSCPATGEFAKACLTEAEAEGYLRGKTGFGWHISDLVIYDIPKTLDHFTGLRDTRFGAEPVEIKRPPQNWSYVEEL